MAGKDNKPGIRFTGFTDAWEQRRLSDISEKVLEKNATLEFTETFTNSAEFGIISQRDFFDHDISNIENLDGYYVVKNEDFVYNPRISTTAPVGPINRNKLGRNGVMSPLYTVFRTHDIDNTFLEQYFKSSYWHSYMKLNGDSGARSDRFSIKDSVFIEMPIPYPNLKEQLKIGEYLTKLDNFISLHQRKYDKLVIVRKSLLEKMFPKDGADVPEIRFDGFTDPWKQCKLGEIADRVQGNDGRMDLPTLTISASKGWLDQRDRFYGNIAGNEQKNYTLLSKGELSYNHGNSKLAKYGTVFELRNYEEALVPRVYHSFRVKEDTVPSFIEYLFASKLPDKELGKLISSGARMDGLLNISYDEFMGIAVVTPQKAEQAKIGAFFRNLDNLITLHQLELEKLKKIKKSMLDKMFV